MPIDIGSHQLRILLPAAVVFTAAASGETRTMIMRRRIARKVMLGMMGVTLAVSMVVGSAGACTGLNDCLGSLSCSSVASCRDRYDPRCPKSDRGTNSCTCRSLYGLGESTFCIRPPFKP